MRSVIISLCILGIAILSNCTKTVGKDPEIGFSDLALLDSAKLGQYKYYQNKDSLLSGSHGPHGAFKLRFNSRALAALTAAGKLPGGGRFPDGSFVVKDIFKNGAVNIYAWMYKRNGAWIWGEAYKDGKFIATKRDGATVCLPCHSQAGNRDYVVAFNFY